MKQIGENDPPRNNVMHRRGVGTVEMDYINLNMFET